MLAPKKVEKNKLIIYVSVIMIMIAGIGFFLYKNYSLTVAKKTITMETPAELGEKDVSGGLSEEEKSGEEALSAGEKEEVNSEIKEAEKEKELLNLDLLANEKFKKLKENTIEERDPKVGKSNPFTSEQNNEIEIKEQ